MKETDFSNRKALERYQGDLNSHIFGRNIQGLWQLILTPDMILTSYLRWNKKVSRSSSHFFIKIGHHKKLGSSLLVRVLSTISQ